MSLTLLFHPLSSFCHKVLIALYENDTPFTPQIVNLQDEGERAALCKLWPMGKFPVLVDAARDWNVSESSIIIEYLDLHFPGKTKFIPADADLARQMRFRDRVFDLYVHLPMQKIVGDRLRPADSKDPYGVAEARTTMTTSARHDRPGDGSQDVGDGRDVYDGRLLRGAGAVLCRQGDAVRRDASTRGRLPPAVDGRSVNRWR